MATSINPTATRIIFPKKTAGDISYCEPAAPSKQKRGKRCDDSAPVILFSWKRSFFIAVIFFLASWAFFGNRRCALGQAIASDREDKHVEVEVVGDFEAALKQKLAMIKDFNKFEEDLDSVIKDPSKFKIIFNEENLKKWSKNPLVQKKVEEMKKNPFVQKFKMDKGNKEKIDEILKKMEKKPENVPPIQNPPIAPGAANPADAANGPAANEGAAQGAAAVQDQLSLLKFFGYDDVDELLERFEHSRFGRLLIKSGVFDELVGELDHFAVTPQNPQAWGVDTKQMAKWGKYLPDVEWSGGWLRGSGFRLGSFRMPSLPRFRLRMPRWGGVAGPVAPTAGSSVLGTVFLGAALLVGVGVLLWYVLAGASWSVSRRSERGWSLGPWPVNPAQVKTKADLVRAYNYLALLLLGPQAMNWNHERIGRELGAPAQPASDTHSLVSLLNQLYERARYAPDREPLSEAEIVQARRHLCTLAGAAHE